MQKGSTLLFVILAIVLIISLGLVFILQRPIKTATPESPQQVLNKEEENIYSEPNLGFEFKYPKELTAKVDTEEEFNKRGNGNFRKNFTYYVTYPPADFLGAVLVLDKTNSFETNPFTVWVFENPDNLTIDRWYRDYWYYPFVWGDYTERRNNVAPIKEATISGQIARFGVVSYQPGEPKFIYLKNNGKMYLLRIIGESSDKILQTFKFLK